MRRGFRLSAALLAAGGVQAAPPKPPAGAPPCPPAAAQVFVAPMGEPFRGEAPAAAWFAAADADRDGRLTAAEMAADADRFFARLDTDGNGEIAPAEIAVYENRIAPEIRLYQPGRYSGTGPYGDGRRRPREDRRRSSGGGEVYDGQLGAGRLTWLNIPEPVASADLDMNRGVSRAEFRSAALARFGLLDKAGAKALTLAALPPLPAQGAPCPPPGDGRKGRR